MSAKRKRRTKIRKLIRFLKFRVLHVDDSPHRIALGIGLGLFIAWTPTIGLQTLMVLCVAPLLRANISVAVPCVWVTNVFTMIPVYYSNYLLGRMLLKPFCFSSGLSGAQILEMFDQLDSLAFFTGFLRIEFWQNISLFLWQKGPELWLGSIVMGLLIGFIAYVITYHFVLWYRKNHRLRVSPGIAKKRDRIANTPS